MNSDQDVDHTAFINESLGGFNLAMGLRFSRATAVEAIAELTIGPIHRQPYGIVHGGVYAAMIETLCSTGAALDAMRRGQSTVGLENSTSFLRATREGTLRGRAIPLTSGKRSSVWQAEIRDDQERLVATGRVRLIHLEPGARAGGEVVALDPKEGGGVG